MLNIKSLERRWLKYKILTYSPYILVLIVAIGLLIGLSIWTNTVKTTNSLIVKNQKSITPVIIQKRSVISPSDENTTFLEPSMEFIQSFQNTPPPNEMIVRPTTVINKPVQQHTVSTQSPKILAVPEYSPASQVVPPAVKTPTNQVLTINREEAKLDIEALSRRFKETSNANLGLFIARYYYDHGNYNEAYNYALKTNSINDRIDESWIIFSKTLVKLGKADMAKKTLQLYIAQSNSENAKGLLNSIENGSFK